MPIKKQIAALPSQLMYPDETYEDFQNSSQTECQKQQFSRDTLLQNIAGCLETICSSDKDTWDALAELLTKSSIK